MVWVVPLSDRGLTPRPLLRLSTTAITSEFDKKAQNFFQVLSNQYLYTIAQSQARLTLELFWEEPAIAERESNITPNPRSPKQID